MKKLNVVKSERVINPETGEVRFRDTIERNPQELINVWNPHQKESRMKHFKSRNSIEVKKMIISLSPLERAFLFTVEPYLDWETNILVGDGQTAGKKKDPLLWKDIDKILGFDQRTRRKVVEELIKKNILAYLEGNHRKGIVINPDYALNGRSPAKALVNAFNSSSKLDEEIDEEIDEKE